MRRIAVVLFILAVLVGNAVLPVSADEPVVQAILFYSPTCGHCHKVITEDLPPLYEAYGGVENVQTLTSVPADATELETENSYGPALVLIKGVQLQVLYVNVAWPIGQELYTLTGDMYNVPDGVPRLVVGDTALVGSVDIPGQFPGIIELGLQNGGIPWPELNGLDAALGELELLVDAAAETTETPAEQTEAAASDTEESSAAASNTPTEEVEAAPTENAFAVFDASDLTVIERIERDLAGNLLSIATLLAMVASVIYAALHLGGKSVNPETSWKHWAVPILSVIGMGVAGYLTFIETTGTEAVCGPVGDCNTVNQSEYAILFGFLPVALMGLLGYIGILAAWFMHHFGKGQIADAARVAIFVFASFGTLFSIYLTFLEPFVIAATCAWCLTSAVLITLQMLISLEPAKASWLRFKNRLQQD
ncbi:MAG: hypothetical protein JXA25_00650 [Anaerolineales bacterium]|nr:hypothetical protein [Anaerolineales bacterium]